VYPAVMIALATANGPGISVDSVSYAAAAASFADAAQLTTYNGSALTVFPPGLSVLLGSLMAIGASLSVATVVVNVLATCLTVVASYLLARQVLLSPGWSLIASAGVSLLAGSVRVGSYLWTEPVFTALVVLALLMAARAVRIREADWFVVSASAALIALATTFRYVGVVAVPVLVLAMAWAASNRRVAKAIFNGVVGSLGLVLVAARNVSLGTSPFGDRYPGAVNLEGAFTGLVVQWGEYVAPSRTTTLTVIVGALVGALIVLGIWLVFVQRNAPGAVIALFVALYWGAILFSQVGTRLDVVTERFGAPVLAPTLILVLVAVRSGLSAAARELSSALGADRNRVHRVLAMVSGGVAVLVVGLSVAHAVDFVRMGSSSGIGLASSSAAERAVVRAALDVPADAFLVSNDPWQVWWSRGGVVLDYPPSRVEWPRERVESDLATLKDAVERNGSVIVIIDENARAFVDLAEVRSSGVNVAELSSPDGVLVAELRKR